jgi:hypothetical protein
VHTLRLTQDSEAEDRYRVRLVQEARQWDEAECLQRVCVEWDHRRAADACDYALAALRDFQSYGQGAAADVQQTQELIAMIEEAMQGSGS